MAILDALDDAGDHFADAVLVLIVLTLTLGIAHLLHDDLLGGLSSNAAKIEGRQLFGQLTANFERRVDFLGFRKTQLFGVVFEFLFRDNRENTQQRLLAGDRVDGGADIMLLAVFRLGSLLDSFLHGLDDDRLVDRLLLGHGLGDLQNFEPVG